MAPGPIPAVRATTGQRIKATRRDFIRIQIRTGMTFAQIAGDAPASPAAARHLAQARTAYRSALRWAREIRVPAHDEVWVALRGLRDRLRALGGLA
jgi:hypothetical protein